MRQKKCSELSKKERKQEHVVHTTFVYNIWVVCKEWSKKTGGVKKNQKLYVSFIFLYPYVQLYKKNVSYSHRTISKLCVRRERERKGENES